MLRVRMQAHVRLHPHSTRSQQTYWHSEIDFFDAYSVVKVIQFRRDHNYDHWSALRLQNTPDWVLKQDGFQRMTFLNQLIWVGSMETLDFQYFMKMVQNLAIWDLRFESVDLVLDLTPLWLCASLTNLWLETRMPALTLTIPTILTAPLESLCLFGFQFKNFHHLIPYLPSFEVLRVGKQAPD